MDLGVASGRISGAAPFSFLNVTPTQQREVRYNFIDSASFATRGGRVTLGHGSVIEPMNDRDPLPWKSIMVLPTLIALSASAVLLVSLHHRLSVQAAIGLFVGALAVVEIGYLLILVAVSRRDTPRRLPVSRGR